MQAIGILFISTSPLARKAEKKNQSSLLFTEVPRYWLKIKCEKICLSFLHCESKLGESVTVQYWRSNTIDLSPFSTDCSWYIRYIWNLFLYSNWCKRHCIPWVYQYSMNLPLVFYHPNNLHSYYILIMDLLASNRNNLEFSAVGGKTEEERKEFFLSKIINNGGTGFFFFAFVSSIMLFEVRKSLLRLVG